MAYVQLNDLAEQPGATELSQVATPIRYSAVDYDLLDAMLRGRDTSGWPADEVEIAQLVIAVIVEARTDADGVIDGFLAKRGYKLPLIKVFPLVVHWSRVITRYFLHKNRQALESNDPIVRDYKDALKFLQMVAEGKFSLGEDDTLTPPNSAAPKTCHPPRVFTTESLKDY
ncbi:DUF1320 domain-containing protein [Entomomonas sp. E2T0]|uniref:gp436 family protein n=1 Tax=Entomomonas sp. E2T0 TaxID=2930213 RepID=UPI002228492B|nr:DUF1320 domain-containing protein [Entomomonas sp. E2T0]UYZ84287.1 DUF1320 domain-containing protein [Entomomonas sp. E2T0]